MSETFGAKAALLLDAFVFGVIIAVAIGGLL